jgi:hypothetical protein
MRLPRHGRTLIERVIVYEKQPNHENTSSKRQRHGTEFFVDDGFAQV